MRKISNMEKAKSFWKWFDTFFWGCFCSFLDKIEDTKKTFRNQLTFTNDQILDNLTNWWLEFLLLLVHTSDWMRNEVSVRTVRTMVGFVKNRPTIWQTTVVHQWQLRNGRYTDLSGGELDTFFKRPESLLSLLPFLKMKKSQNPKSKKH